MSRARAADIIGTVTSPGWNDVVAIAEEVVTEFKDRLMACENDDAVLRLQHEAHAAQVFLAEWKQRVESAMQLEEVADFQSVAF